MRFDKEKFKEKMSFATFSKKDIIKDWLSVLGKITQKSVYDDLGRGEEAFIEQLKLTYGEKFYDTDGHYVYLKEYITLASVLTMPFKLIFMLFMWICVLMIILVAAPFVATTCVILSK